MDLPMSSRCYYCLSYNKVLLKLSLLCRKSTDFVKCFDSTHTVLPAAEFLFSCTHPKSTHPVTSTATLPTSDYKVAGISNCCVLFCTQNYSVVSEVKLHKSDHSCKKQTLLCQKYTS